MPSTQEAMNALLACVCDALSDAGRPTCECYATVGSPVIGSCCECEEGTDGQVSIHFRRLFEADATSLTEVRRIRPCKGGTVAAQFRIVLARCFPVLDDNGELPDPLDLGDAADGQITDVNAIWWGLACCTGLELSVDDISADLQPTGGCSALFADVTVRVTVPRPVSSL